MTNQKRKPKTELIRYKIPKAAAGGCGDGEGPTGGFYKPGQNINCEVIRSASGGYEVFDTRAGYSGFMPSDQRHVTGDKVQAQFVCVQDGRLLLSERFVAGKSNSA